MALTKAKKKEVLDKVKGILDTSSSVVFVNFHGLPVADTTDMRRDLREKQLGYYVAKKTLVKKAIGGAKIAGDIPELEGELAVVFNTEEGSEDITAPAREVYNFQKKFDGAIAILGGIFESQLVAKDRMMGIAQIPGMQTLRGQFANVVNSPIQGLVVALNSIAEKKV